jgi:hypothetical protein
MMHKHCGAAGSAHECSSTTDALYVSTHHHMTFHHTLHLTCSNSASLLWKQCCTWLLIRNESHKGRQRGRGGAAFKWLCSVLLHSLPLLLVTAAASLGHAPFNMGCMQPGLKRTPCCMFCLQCCQLLPQ